MSADEHLDAPPHPCIGSLTRTYLFDGSILHCDSLRMVQAVEAGVIYGMTAGSGIVLMERTPLRLRRQSKRLHGLQIWVARSKQLETLIPACLHIAAAAILSW